MPERSSKLPEEDQPVIGPEGLRNRENGGASPTGTGSPSGKPASTGRGSSGSSGGGGDAAGRTEALQRAEDGAAGPEDEDAARDTADKLGAGYVDSGPTRRSRLRRKITRRRVATGATLAGLGAGGGLVVFLALLPLKTETIVKNLEQDTFGTSESALDQEINSMLENYLVTKVLPAYRRCGTTISKDCQPTSFGDNPVDRLYKTWANVRLENTLATKYHIEFKYNADGTWNLKAPGTASGGDNIGKDGKNLDSDFNRADRGEMRQAIKDALKDSTSWDKVWYRYKVGILLQEKYGIKRCNLFCGTRDTLAGKFADQKIAYRLIFTQKVISPYTKTLGVAMECLLSPSCAPEHTQPNDVQDGTNAESGGAPTSDFDNQVQHDLAEIAKGYGTTATPEELEKTYNKLKEKGYQAAILDEVLAKIGLNDLAGQILDKAAIIGWINTAANTITAIANAGPKLTKIIYVIKGAALVQTYMIARTGADELHTGHNTAAEVGSLNDMYGPVTSNPTNQPVTGGTAGAEQSRLYQAWIERGATVPPSAAFLDNPLTSKAYAAATADSGPNGEVCNDGKHPQGTDLACPENKAGGGVAVVNNVSHSFNTPPLSYVTTIANAWSNTLGGIANFAGNIFGAIIGAIPGISDITSFIAKAGQPLEQFFANGVISNDFGVVQGGVRTFVQTAGGAAVAGSDAASALGAKQVSPATYVGILNEQQAEDKQAFARQSFFARMFSTDSQYSLVSRVAMDIPFGTQAMAQSGIANMLNPLGTISHGFAAILSGKASAASSLFLTSDTPDKVFGTTLNAWPKKDIPKGSPDLWNQECSDNASYGYMKNNDRNTAAATGPTNPENGMPVFTTENPCQLMMGAIGSGGGLFDTDNLTSDDKTDLNNAAGGATDDSTTSTAGATINMGDLYKSSVSVACAPGTNDDGTADGYTGGHKVKIRLCEIPNFAVTDSSTQKNGHAVMNSRVSGAVLAMVTAAKQAGVNMSADNTFRTMSEQQSLWVQLGEDPNRVAQPGYSNHQMGLAIDFNDVGSSAAPGTGPVWDWLDKNASNFDYKNYPAEAWHWSPTGN